MSNDTKQSQKHSLGQASIERVKFAPTLFRHAPLSGLTVLVLMFGAFFVAGTFSDASGSVKSECCGELKAKDVASWRERVRDAQMIDSDDARETWSTESLSFVASMQDKSNGAALASWQTAEALVREFSAASSDQAGAVAHRMSLLADRMASILVGESAPVLPYGSGGGAATPTTTVLSDETTESAEAAPAIVNQDSSGALQSR